MKKQVVRRRGDLRCEGQIATLEAGLENQRFVLLISHRVKWQQLGTASLVVGLLSLELADVAYPDIPQPDIHLLIGMVWVLLVHNAFLKCLSDPFPLADDF